MSVSLKVVYLCVEIISYSAVKVGQLTHCTTDEWVDFFFLCLNNRRLLEKSQRIEAILASLQASGAEPEQLTEVEEMITAPEKQQLESLRLHINK